MDRDQREYHQDVGSTWLVSCRNSPTPAMVLWHTHVELFSANTKTSRGSLYFIANLADAHGPFISWRGHMLLACLVKFQ